MDQHTLGDPNPTQVDAPQGSSSREEPSQEQSPAGTIQKRQRRAAVQRRLFGRSQDEITIGRYRVLEELGVGGMGVVYAAHDPELDRKVAIKLLRAELSHSDDDAQVRLQREAQAIARLAHPNVVAVFDVGEHEGQVYIAMEFVEGTRLDRWLDEHKPSWREILRLFLQAGEGLAAAHAAGVIHRDFKPENVIVGADGRVRVLDFGLAAPASDLGSDAVDAPPNFAELKNAASNSNVRITRTGVLLGTPAYMAPEQHEGRPADARSDQFSFCVALYRALYKQAPFAGETLLSLADSVVSGQLQPFPQKHRVPSTIRRILRRGLAPVPDDRFDSLQSLLRQIESFLGRRRRRTAGAAFAGAVLLTAITVGMLRGEGESEGGICGDGLERLGQAWGDERREALSQAWTKGELPEEKFKSLELALDDYAKAWTEVQSQSCESDAPAHQRYQPLSCLAWRLQEIETLTQLLTTSEIPDVEDLAYAVKTLPSPRLCTDEQRLQAAPVPPSDPKLRAEVQELRLQLAKGDVLLQAGRYEQARQLADESLKRAKEIDYRPVQAQAHRLVGALHAKLGNAVKAYKNLEEALYAAEAGGNTQVIAEAASLIMGVVGFNLGEGPKEFESYARRAEAALERLGDDPVIRARLHAARSRAYSTQGRLPEAVKEAMAWIAIADQSGEVEAAHAHLGLVFTIMGRYAPAQQQFDRALEIVDPEHPRAVYTLGSLGILQGFQGYDKESLESFARARRLGEVPGATQPQLLAVCLTYLAVVVERQKGHEFALGLHQQAVERLKSLWNPKSAVVGRAYYHLANTQAQLGKLDEAEANYKHVMKLWEALMGEGHRSLTQPMTGLARVHLERGELKQATELLEPALKLVEAIPGHPSEDARTRFYLSKAIVAAPDVTAEQRARAVELAATAVKVMEPLGPGFDPERASMQAWSDELNGKKKG